MFTLKLLGGASLEGPGGPLTGRVAQKRRLATLAFLAMSRRPGVGREKLAALLWPESDGERARHLLSDTVYVINRALGGEAIAAVADELRLAPERLACDAGGFEAAVAAGELDEATRLYTGPFLDGFFVDGSDEFERWAAAERERLAAAFAQTLERAALARAVRGDGLATVDAWRRLAAHDPVNSRTACQLADALERAGDIAGALQHLQAHVDILKTELGIGAPAEVASRLRALRAPRPEPAAVGPAVSVPAPSVAVAPAAAAPVPLPPLPPSAGPSPELPAPAATAPASGMPVTAAATTSGQWWRTALAVAAIVVAAFAAVAWWRPVPPVTATALASVAVLPFSDLSPGGDQEYFGDGIAEELTTRLGRVAGLRVAARTSAFAFKGRSQDVPSIGRALGVDGLLEGSVRSAEGRVRIAVRLVDARSGYQIWSDSWESAGRDVLTMQDEVAAGVLGVLRPGTATMAPATRRIDPAAYDLYLKGRYLWHRRTRDSLTEAAAAFEQAVALAPDFAEAHSGEADAFAVLGFYDHLPPREAFPRAKAAALRALRLNPDLAEAHASLGYTALYYDWDWAAAERALDRAIGLNPSYSTAHQWRANLLVARGRFDEAVSAMRRAQAIDPLSLIASAALGWVQYYRGDFDAAVQQCRTTIALNAGFEQAWVWGGMALEAAGRLDDARDMLDRAAALSRRSPSVLAALARTMAVAGDRNGALALKREIERGGLVYLPAYEMAKLSLGLGDTAEALDWLRRARDQRSHSLVFLAVDPQLAALRHTRAFLALVAEVGAAP